VSWVNFARVCHPSECATALALSITGTMDKQVGTDRQHSQIQGKSLEPSIFSITGDSYVTSGKPLGKGWEDWIILSQASLAEEGATTIREWALE
jgi:hypothetical protein